MNPSLNPSLSTCKGIRCEGGIIRPTERRDRTLDHLEIAPRRSSRELDHLEIAPHRSSRELDRTLVGAQHGARRRRLLRRPRVPARIPHSEKASAHRLGA